jgi:aspartyl/asparaginyl-tRNA synthetase
MARRQPGKLDRRLRVTSVVFIVDDDVSVRESQFLREVAHLRPRTNVIGAATRVRHTLAQAIHRFWYGDGHDVIS